MTTMTGFVDAVLPACDGCARLVFVESVSGKKWTCTGTPDFRGAIPQLCQLAHISGWPIQPENTCTDFLFTEIGAIPPLVLGDVSYVGNSPFVVMALGGVGQGFETIEEARRYMKRLPIYLPLQSSQLFQLVDGKWVEIK